MALRIVHTIHGECDIFLQKTSDNVRIRISDNPNSSSPDPADFELEGSIKDVRELVATLKDVMSHIDSMSEEVN